MKTVYLSGPITGRPMAKVYKHFNNVMWAIYAEAEKRQVALRIINPTIFSGMGLTWETYMKMARSILQDPSIDAICMMKGWEKSDGCKLELMWAHQNRLKVIYEAGAKKM